jgi:hypothetical protein
MSKKIPEATIKDLVNLRTMARAAATAFNEAIAGVVETYEVEDRVGLRRYVCALEDDKVEKLSRFVDTVAGLIEEDQA